MPACCLPVIHKAKPMLSWRQTAFCANSGHGRAPSSSLHAQPECLCWLFNTLVKITDPLLSVRTSSLSQSTCVGRMTG